MKKKVVTEITARQVRGAYHQSEGIVIQIDDGNEYTFVPRTSLIKDESGDLSCVGTATLIQDGQFTNHKYEAELFLPQEEVSDSQVLIEFLHE